MRAQRVRDAENRIELQIAKWTAEGTVKGRYMSPCQVFCDVGHTSVAGDMLVSRKVHGVIHESRWHRGSFIPVLDRFHNSVRGGFFVF